MFEKGMDLVQKAGIVKVELKGELTTVKDRGFGDLLIIGGETDLSKRLLEIK